LPDPVTPNKVWVLYPAETCGVALDGFGWSRRARRWDDIETRTITAEYKLQVFLGEGQEMRREAIFCLLTMIESQPMGTTQASSTVA